MTEREIPDGLGFLFGGLTDAPIPASAPPALSAPENPVASAAPAAADPAGAPVYSSRREARAAQNAPFGAAAGAPSAAVAAAAPSAPAYDGIASLFPLLGEVTESPVESPLPAPSAFDAILAPPPGDLATRAMPVAEVAAELATPVAPYVVPQSAPVPIVAVPIVPVPMAQPMAQVPIVPVPMAQSPASETDPFLVSRRAQRNAAPAATARPGSGRKSSSRRPKRVPRVQAERHAWARGEGPKGSTHPASDRARAADLRAAGERKPIRQRIFGVGVMVLVGGLFAVLAIPAYADNGAATLTAAAAVQTQKLSVEGAAASSVTATARDGYTATSAADLKALYAAAMRQQNIAAYLRSGAKDQGDDYPWFAELSRNQGGGLSPLGYYYRECVDFVAWRLNRDVGSTKAPFRWVWSNLTPNGGSGHEWKSNWLAHGWATGTTPEPGAVAWFGDNHVAYVNGILANGQVFIEEYNQAGTHMYDTRVINAGDAYYLYAPPK
jgi:surface antigen